MTWKEFKELVESSRDDDKVEYIDVSTFELHKIKIIVNADKKSFYIENC